MKYKIISINKPGPTDLTWEEENPVDYRYRPTDLPKIVNKKEVMMDLRLRRAIFVYEGTRLHAKMLKCPIIPKKWEDREKNFKNQFIDLVNDLIEGKRKFRNFKEAHDSWVKKYLDMGWRYSKKYDPKERTHPDLVPYNKLDPKEKIKDEVFLNFVGIAKKYLW